MPRESARGKKAEAKPAAVAAAAADKAKAPAAADGDAPVVHKFVPPDGGALRLTARHLAHGPRSSGASARSASTHQLPTS